MAQWIEDPQGRPEVEKVTKEMKLPVWKANHKGKFREFWNEVWEKIEDYILKLKGDTEKNSKGLNDRLVSAVGKHDGDFPVANAVVGNVYYSELTKKYYKCKIGGPAPMPNGNFIDLSILENLNRLENLFKTEKLFDGLAKNVGEVLINNLPSWVKTLKIQSSNHDNYYFQDVYISVDTLKQQKTVFISIGTLNDIRSYGLSLKNGVLKIENTNNLNATADNNYIRKIYGLNY